MGFCLFTEDSKIVEHLSVDLIDLARGSVFLSDGQVLFITEWLSKTRKPTEELSELLYVTASNDEMEMVISLACAGDKIH
jgi:hypothetical protein